MGRAKNGEPVRLISKRHRTVVRIIRTTVHNGKLAWVCRDETYGGVAILPLEQYTSGAWRIKK